MLRGATLEFEGAIAASLPSRRTVDGARHDLRDPCQVRLRLGESARIGVGVRILIPVREVAACDRLIQTSDFASYRASCCAEYRNAAAGTTSSGRMTIHLRRLTTAR